MSSAAFLIIITMAYGGMTQSVTAIRYGSMKECSKAKETTGVRLVAPDARVISVECTGKQPTWWVR